MNLLINCISGRLAPHILSIKNECTFVFLKFLMIGLCNSPVNSLLEIFSFLTGPPEVFLTKKNINYWNKSMLISIMITIFSKIKCFITQYFIRSCSFSYFQSYLPKAMSYWKQALSSLFWQIYRKSPVSLNFCIISFFFFVNGPQALYINPGYLKCISGINLSPTNKNLFTL